MRDFLKLRDSKRHFEYSLAEDYVDADETDRKEDIKTSTLLISFLVLISHFRIL